MLLLYTSRLLSVEKTANWNMVALMTGAYLVCLGKITIGLRMPSPPTSLPHLLTNPSIVAIHIGGAGHHLLTLPYPTITTALQLNTALQLICPLTTSLSKLSILCLFHTLFARTSPRSRLVIRTTFALTLLTLLIQILIPLLNCKPFSATWTLSAHPSACAIPGLSLWKYLSVPNLVTTLVVVCIPVPALYKLRVSTATKAGLAVVLGVCVAAVVAAVMRFESFLAVRSFEDFTFEQVRPLCWTVAESGTYMVAGVLPTLRPLVGRVCGGWRLERVTGGFRESGRSAEGGSAEGRVGEIRMVRKEKGFEMLGTEDTLVGGNDVEKEVI